MPKVSVIIPTYNRAKYITRAIDSVLNQTYQDFEIIVVDDGSKDNTKEILTPYMNKIHYLWQENRGISAARNIAIQRATGEYIAFLDSDDVWLNNKLQIQVDILNKSFNIGLVHNKMIMLSEQGQKVGMKPKRESGKDFKELLEIGGDLPTSSVMVRRECFDKTGLFDENLPIMEDFEMWLRIAKEYDLYEIKDQHLAYYYRHDQQITRNRIKVFDGTVRLQKKILKIHKNVPKSSIKRKLYHNQYLLARAYYDEKNFSMAIKCLSQTILAYPLVGMTFYRSTDSVNDKIIKIFKPFAFCTLCLLKGLTK